MHKIKNLIAASILLAAFFSEAQERSLIENIGVKINYSQTNSFERDFTPAVLDWQHKNYRTFRLGLSYDVATKKKWNYNYNISIDWSKDIINYTINDPDFDEQVFSRRLTGNGTVYFIFESQFLYALNKSQSLHGMIAPQINFTLFDDEGRSGIGGSNSLNGYSYRLNTVDRNRIIRPSLALGLQYDLPTKTKMRLGAFYSYSFTPIYFGEFTYENSNGVTASGEWEQKGHQAGITFQIFPFFKRPSN
ncbi:hypothetical protein A9Q93_06840 [Nonlabens dokdonensis]|uniref:Outer membrane protein beta-barrel domain-containing protein n=1 Tax=Nonlabens dokdonensis TaxID=328515 RepID=A0A1Z8AYN3_9FLAO|nr:hypothetical protein [Nonlabens dokdonensis]OUS15454.1 hypothetical protein A9Q93_06840 [Nonlabens dokdonensis]